MLRVIVKEHDAGRSVNVGGDVEIRFRTFEIDAPELEKHLRDHGAYQDRHVVGVEVPRLPDPDPEEIRF